MKIKEKISRLLSGVVSSAVLLSGMSIFSFDAPYLEADAASACTVNTNKTYQRIRGFGGIDLPEWQGYSLSDAEKARAFGNGDGQLGLTVLRVYVNPNSSQWKQALPTAQYATKQGATVFATPWEPPSNLGESGGNNGKLHLPKKNYAAYAKHLNDFGTYMKNNGVDLYSISVQNEPDYAKEWTYWSPDETTDFIANYGDQITSTRLMSPETFQYGAWNNSRDYYNKILNNSKAMANCDVFATHFYGTPRNKMDFPALESCGKEIWMTEVYVPDSKANSANNWPDAIQVAENIHNGLVVGNMSVYTWWYIKRSYSLIAQDGNNGAITKRGYMMAQFSKYVRPGDVRIDCTEQPDSNILVSAYKHSDTQVEVVAINKGTTEINQTFNISGRTIKNVDRVRSSGSENLAKTKSMAANGSSFNSQLPANSVSTYIITLESDGKEVPSDPDTPVSQEPITPDANGYYYHDTFENSNDDWEARGSSELTLSGKTPFKGTNALLIQNREKSWNGVQKSLDAATFKGGQEYSFSVAAAGSGNMMLSLQYTDASGETKYAHIADGVSDGNYVHLANPNFKLPEGSGYIFYVETEEGTDNFYIDEAIVAKAGTQIEGPKPVETTAATTTSTTSTTTASTTTTTTTTAEATAPATEAATSAPATEATAAPTTEAATSPAATAPAVTTAPANGILYGDANLDNNVTVADAVAILQSIANKDKYELKGQAYINADCFNVGDGVTAKDALTIQQLDSGLVKSLPVGGNPAPQATTQAPAPETTQAPVTQAPETTKAPETTTETTAATTASTQATTTAAPVTVTPITASFENGSDNWTARGEGVSITNDSDSYYSGSKSAKVSGRTKAWNGIAYTLGSDFKAGSAYSFSAAVMQASGADQEIMLSLQYTGTDGQTAYAHIASEKAADKTWTKLENTSYTIPEGASDIILYIETADSTCDLYIDDITAASEGTKSSITTGGGKVGEIKAPAATGGVDISWIDPSKPMVAISFDDGTRDATQEKRIIDALDKNGFHATFFYVGNWITSPETVKYAFQKGNEIANHTTTHPYLTQKSSSEIRSEYDQTAAKLKDIIGTEPSKLMRLPYLASNATVQQTLNDVPLISCAIDTGDWNGATKDQIVNKIKSAMNDGSLKNSIVLCHENYSTTAGAMEEVLPYLKAQGWQVVTISEMYAANGKTLAGGQIHKRC